MNVTDYNTLYEAQHQVRNDFHDELKFHPNAREVGCCAVNSNSILRNGSAFAAEVSKPFARVAAIAAPLTAVSLVAHGILGAPCASAIIRDSYKKGKQALACGDAEGVVNGVAMGSVGSAYLTACGLLTYQGVQLLTGAAIVAGAAVATASLGVGMYGALGLISAYNLKQTRDFGNELADLKNSPAEALKWLNDQISLTPEEQKLSPEKAKQLLQKKWNQFELRSGLDSGAAKRVREELPDLFEKIYNAQSNSPELQEKAVQLIEEIEKSNFKAQIKHILLLLIVAVGLASMIAAIIFSGGLVVPLLMTIAAGLWMTVDHSGLHSYIGDQLWDLKHGVKQLDELPLLVKA